jgi:MOSC domain-containing protein YiiM
MVSHRSIRAIAGKGLAHDRYATGRGFYTGVPEWDAHVTLLASEPILALATEHDCILEPEILRRNLLTQGMNLETLVGKKFRIGPEVVLYGRKLWPPCSHIVKQTNRVEIFKYLAKDTGLGADVLTGGLISCGDEIVPLP